MQDEQHKQVDLGVDFLIAFFGEEAKAFAQEQLETSRESGNDREAAYWDAVVACTRRRLDHLGVMDGLSEDTTLLKASPA